MKNALEELDRLLESRLSEHLQSVPDAAQIVASALARNHKIALRVFQERGGSLEAVRHTFSASLAQMERVLEAKIGSAHLSNTDMMQHAASTLYQSRPRNRACRYLSAAAAAELLTHMPPVVLANFDANLVEQDPLAALALTRFTESDEWQDAYLAALAKLPAQSFELRAPTFRVFDRKQLSLMLEGSKRTLKPWSMSHCREAGIIVCITHDENNPPHLPILLFTALFYHYLFEIARAGESLARHIVHQPETAGAHVAAIITSTRRTHSFLHPNIHSEALYWEDALAHMNAVFPALNLAPYLPLLSHGDFLGAHSATPLSLNIVDHLWDAALDQKKTGGYRYHFQEAFWSETLWRLRKLWRDEATHAVLHSLELDDIAFTEQMFEKARRPRTFFAHAKAATFSLKHRVRRMLD
ncbi:MAG TPA: hypothetical protein VN495_03740 [Candidatus Paceibacterota bacterium]|nr:hypothetical protein [Candidatus Paceibacterota bacterium]